MKKSFELREMEISIKIIFPMTLIHTVSLIPYMILSSMSLQDNVYEHVHTYIIYTEYSLIVS